MKYSYQLLVVSVALILSNCGGQLGELGMKTFNQGTKIGAPQKIVTSYVRSLKVYREFETIGIFDALWLSDQVRTAYVTVYAQKHQQSDAQLNEYLRKQLVENERSISFYVLAYTPQTPDTIINDPNNAWSLVLEVNGEIYHPESIQSVDLNPEYIFFLQKYLSKFKPCYLIKFPAKTRAGQVILNEGITKMSLVFTTESQTDRMVWEIENGVLVGPHKRGADEVGNWL